MHTLADHARGGMPTVLPNPDRDAAHRLTRHRMRLTREAHRDLGPKHERAELPAYQATREVGTRRIQALEFRAILRTRALAGRNAEVLRARLRIEHEALRDPVLFVGVIACENAEALVG